MNETRTDRILVMGASGYIGSHLAPRLLERGYRVRAASRHRETLDGRGWTGANIVEADVLDASSLKAALEDVDVAYYLVHSMGAGGDFADLDRKGAENFRDAAAEAGIRRIVYVGGLQPKGDLSEHLRSRRETGDILRSGPVQVVEVRAGIVVGAGSAAFEVIRDLSNHLPVMITPRWVRSRTQPIALDDLLVYLEALVGLEVPPPGILEVGGPEILEYAELMKQYAAAVGKRPYIIPVPFLTPRLSSYWLDLVTSVPASIARPLIDGLRHDFLADDRAIRSLIPSPLHSYRDAVQAALDAERSQPLPARWTDGALAFRGYNPEHSYYSKGARTETRVAAPAAAVWKVVRTLGGRRGYFYASFLWRIRGAMDRLVGGVGMRRGRRHPSDIRVGDAIDFWRVAAIEDGRRLTLVAEMKLPGSAVLEIEVIPISDESSSLYVSARFHPSGVVGLAYWYALLPVHNVIFNGMPRAIAKRAEQSGTPGVDLS